MIMTCTTRITRKYLENKTKADLAQMYLDLLKADIRLEKAAKAVIFHEREYREINNLGKVGPACFEFLADLLGYGEKLTE
jgi:hypothetical protein